MNEPKRYFKILLCAFIFSCGLFSVVVYERIQKQQSIQSSIDNLNDMSLFLRSGYETLAQVFENEREVSEHLRALKTLVPEYTIQDFAKQESKYNSLIEFKQQYLTGISFTYVSPEIYRMTQNLLYAEVLIQEQQELIKEKMSEL